MLRRAVPRRHPQRRRRFVRSVVEIGAIDAECMRHGEIAALMPDTVAADQVASALGVGVDAITLSPATGRDDRSCGPSRRPICIGRLTIVPAHTKSEAAGALQLIDSAAFGTGLHPTTVLCLEVLEEHVRLAASGRCARRGDWVGCIGACGADAWGSTSASHRYRRRGAARCSRARTHQCDRRTVGFETRRAGSGDGNVAMVLANVLPAPLIEMAPALVRRVGHHGHLVLSGIPSSVEPEVDHAYRRLGMQCMSVKSRAGWIALVPCEHPGEPWGLDGRWAMGDGHYLCDL